MLVEFTTKFKKIIDAAAESLSVSVFSLGLGERTILADKISENKKALYICSDIMAARKVYEQFSAISSEVALLPAKDDQLYYRDSIVVENYIDRLSSLGEIARGNAQKVITCVEAAMQLFPALEDYKNALIYLETNKEYLQEKLIADLVSGGYKRTDTAILGGSFAVKGDIVDICPPAIENGIRLEYFGDNIESVSFFDKETLRSTEKLEKFTLYPASEVFYNNDDASDILAKIIADIKKPEGESANYHNLVSKLTADLSLYSKDQKLSIIAPFLNHSNIFDFFKPEVIFFDDAKQIVDYSKMLLEEYQNRYKIALLNGETFTRSIEHLQPLTPLTPSSPLSSNLYPLIPKVAFHPFDSQNRIFNPDQIFHLKTAAFPNYAKNLDLLSQDVKIWLGQDYTVKMFVQNSRSKDNYLDFFSREKVEVGGKLELLEETLPYSAIFFDEKIVLLGTNALSFQSTGVALKKKKRDSFVEVKPGEYVVHSTHGIGFFSEIVKLEALGALRDYALINYYGTDKLYVPVESIDSLSYYDTAAGIPTLNRLGTGEFIKLRTRAQKTVEKIALDLRVIYAKRQMAVGHKFNPDNSELDTFISHFPYTDTACQSTATKEAVNDLTGGKIMDRLLCGDVGFGKTEVALRAAYKVILEGKQVAFLAPTTILASQHYKTASRRYQEFGVSVATLSRFSSIKDAERVLAGLKAGTIDIVCGTHRLLSKDVIFKDLGLLILDEEQRFGVKDKEKIKELKESVSVLTLSATPIPRTLHLSLSGIRDISVLDTPPASRLPVRTFVTEYTESLVYDAINREVNRGGQSFVVFNRVEQIYSFAAKLKSFLPPGIEIEVVHGQLPPLKIEDTIIAFQEGKIQVLVSSTIIENGIDMPNANTLIVVDSEKFGLSQLYQLRGRVGRSNRLAYSYFTYDSQKELSEGASKRLEAIGQFTALGSGFKIAMRDLEIRGAGNILGREQHGHIDRIGYDMYNRLLLAEIEKIKNGKQFREKAEVKVITDFNAYLPDDYCEGLENRAKIYSRVSTLESKKEFNLLLEELTEIYGGVPKSLENLMLVALLKNRAAEIGAKVVTIKKKECSILFSKASDINNELAQISEVSLVQHGAKASFNSDREAMANYLLA